MEFWVWWITRRSLGFCGLLRNVDGVSVLVDCWGMVGRDGRSEIQKCLRINNDVDTRLLSFRKLIAFSEPDLYRY
jgi:hypothetical protein